MAVPESRIPHSFHAIVGPDGMCECGVRADGTLVTCGGLLEAYVQDRLASSAAPVTPPSREAAFREGYQQGVAWLKNWIGWAMNGPIPWDAKTPEDAEKAAWICSSAYSADLADGLQHDTAGHAAEPPQPGSAERTLASLAAMLGWMNVPPQHIFEAEIRAMKARIQASATEPPALWRHAVMECNEAHAALDKHGAPTTSMKRRVRGPEGDQEVTVGLAARIHALAASRPEVKKT